MSSSVRVLAAEAVGAGALASICTITAAAGVASIVGPAADPPLPVPLWAVAAGGGVLLLLFCLAYALLRSWRTLDLNPIVTVARLTRHRAPAGEAVDRLLAQVVGIAVVSVVAWWAVTQQTSLPALTTTTLLVTVAAAVLLSLVPAAVRELVGDRSARATRTPVAVAAPVVADAPTDEATSDIAEPVMATVAPHSDQQWEREGFDLMPILLATEPFEAAATEIVEPALVEPAGLESSVSEPAVSEPAVSEPAVSEPALAEPAVLERSTDAAALRRNADLAAFMSLVGEAQPAADPVGAVPVAVPEPLVLEAVAPEPVVAEPFEPEPFEPAAVVVAPVVVPEPLLPDPVVVPVSAVPESAVVPPVVEPASSEPVTPARVQEPTPKRKKHKGGQKDKHDPDRKRRGAPGVHVTVNVYLDGVRRKGRKS